MHFDNNMQVGEREWETVTAQCLMRTFLFTLMLSGFLPCRVSGPFVLEIYFFWREYLRLGSLSDPFISQLSYRFRRAGTLISNCRHRTNCWPKRREADLHALPS